MTAKVLGIGATPERTVPRGSAKKRNIFIVHPSAVLTDSRANGDGLLCYRYICELAQRGNHVSVACETIELKRPIPANVTLYPLHLRLSRFKLLRRIEYAIKMRRLFVRLSATEQFDLAHQLNPVYAGLSLGLVGINIPLILGPYVAYWPSLRLSWLGARATDAIGWLQQRFADAILLSGSSARSRILSKRLRPTNISTVPYGIDLQMFPEQPFPTGDPTILYLAGFAQRKGVFVLLAAFDLVAARVPNARLTVAGDGIERKQVMDQAAKSPYRDRISFVGFVPHADVPKTVGNCTVFCLPSFGEPYGMSLVEAMATGRAVVATASGGPVDLVDPRGGALVPPGDIHEMARALEMILIDPQLARSMGSFNRSAMTAFGWPAVIDKLEAVYDRVIHQRRGHATIDERTTTDSRRDSSS